MTWRSRASAYWCAPISTCRWTAARVADDGRITASLPTLNALAGRGARVIVCAHLGRPGGRADLRYSLAPVAARLAELLGREVSFPGDIVGAPARSAIAAMRPGD